MRHTLPLELSSTTEMITLQSHYRNESKWFHNLHNFEFMNLCLDVYKQSHKSTEHLVIDFQIQTRLDTVP